MSLMPPPLRQRPEELIMAMDRRDSKEAPVGTLMQQIVLEEERETPEVIQHGCPAAPHHSSSHAMLLNNKYSVSNLTCIQK